MLHWLWKRFPGFFCAIGCHGLVTTGETIAHCACRACGAEWYENPYLYT